MGEKTHLDLFSGIGGFSLASNAAGYDTRVFCERDEFCRGILRHHWPATPIIDDIRNFDGTQWPEPTLLSGGWPCQPVSNAGQRLGKEDHRWLWPELLRIIKESRPRWFLGENVTGIRNMGLDSCLSDLESAGYSVWPVVLPACAKNAPHRRDRFWFIGFNVAHPDPTRQPQPEGGEQEQRGWPLDCGERENVAHANSGEFHATEQGTGGGVGPCGSGKDVAHPSGQRQQGQGKPGDASNSEAGGKGAAVESGDGCINGAGGIESGMGELVDGLPAGLFGHPGFRREPDIPRVGKGIKKRKQKLMALGNSIVPHIAYEIIKLMEKAERQTP